MKPIKVRAKQTDPETSHQAAFEFEQNQTKANKSVKAVVQLLTDLGPLTDFEIINEWPKYWEGPFSYSLPPKARLWARERGFVKRVGYGEHNGRKVLMWGIGMDEFAEPVCCPTCGRKTRSEKVIARINGAEADKPKAERPKFQKGAERFFW